MHSLQLLTKFLDPPCTLCYLGLSNFIQVVCILFFVAKIFCKYYDVQNLKYETLKVSRYLDGKGDMH